MLASEALLLSVLSLCMLVQTATLFLYFRQKRDPQRIVLTVEGKGDVSIHLHAMQEYATNIKWHTEMLLSNDFGKLTIGQQEMVNNISDSSHQLSNDLKRLGVSGDIQGRSCVCTA